MILERLKLENFRQFKGVQEIEFSDIKERNVTIIHAENGFGKTTILKAILWGFYGKEGLKEDFEKPDNILHEGISIRAKDPSSVSALVEITFKHDNDRYVLTRQLTLAQQHLDASKASISLSLTRDGQTRILDRPQQRIQALIPDGISGFLFFNGERINYLAEERNSSRITDAIHQMLGLSLLRITIDDLRHQNVRGKLRGEQKESASGEKNEKILELEAIERELDVHTRGRQVTLSNISAIEEDITKIDAKLSANSKAHELQNRRTKLIEERKQYCDKRDDVESRLAKLIAEDGYMFFTSDLVKRGQSIVARLRSEGKIPARVLNSFLQELIDSATCICQRGLLNGTAERKAVEGLLTIAGDQNFNNAVGALDHAIGLIEGASAQAQAMLRDLNRDRLDALKNVRDRDEEIEEIHQALGGKVDEEVRHLEDTRNSLSLQRDEQISARARLDVAIEQSKQRIVELQNVIRLIADKEDSAALAQRRVDAVEDCIAVLEDILQAETEDLRPLLNGEIDKLFRLIMAKDYWAELTEDYTLRIRKQVVGRDGQKEEIDAALSTGERTVTSLVFIASLVALARRRSDIPTILKGLAGSEYPVVIDSPFGSLSIFRDGVARNIPALAPQVLLLVSPEQYNGQVERALSETNRVGRRYYLKYHGPAIPDRASPELMLGGRTLVQYCPVSDDEFTSIQELDL